MDIDELMRAIGLAVILTMDNILDDHGNRPFDEAPEEIQLIAKFCHMLMQDAQETVAESTIEWEVN
jgi:hypothetical protein